MKRRLVAGNSLMGIIVAFLIVVVAVVFFVSGGMGMVKDEKGEEYKREDGLGQTSLGRARYAAEDSVCRQQLGQVRGLVLLAVDPVDEVYPPRLADVGGMPTGYDACPLGKEPYEYDASNGSVKCAHPGHEKY